MSRTHLSSPTSRGARVALLEGIDHALDLGVRLAHRVGGKAVSRLLSLIIVVAYVVGVGIAAGTVSAFKMLAAMLLPVACVWFPEAMGDYTQGHVNRRSSPAFVLFLGWTLLFLPAIVATILWFQGVPLGSL